MTLVWQVTLYFHFIAFCGNMIQVRVIESSIPFFLRAEPRNRVQREPVNVYQLKRKKNYAVKESELRQYFTSVNYELYVMLQTSPLLGSGPSLLTLGIVAVV